MSTQLFWVDLEEFPSFNAVATHLYSTICSADTNMLPVILSPLAHNDTGNTVGIFAQQIKTAMKRGRYLLAFDSLGEFASNQPEQKRAKEFKALLQFWSKLASN